MKGIDVHVYNRGRKRKPYIIFILGWGDTDPDLCIKDIVELEQGFEFHVVIIPLRIEKSFLHDYVLPIQNYINSFDHDISAVFSHSCGGLIARYLKTKKNTKHIYFSPWWGFSGEKFRSSSTYLMKVFRFINIDFIPIDFKKEELGLYGGIDKAYRQVPKKVSPKWLYECYNAQQNAPTLKGGSIVFYTLADTVIGLDRIGEYQRTHKDIKLVRYGGRHVFFFSKDCKKIFKQAIRFVKKKQPPF